MIIFRSIAVTALALCGAVRDALHHASPRLSLQGIAERGQGGANTGYAALLTTLHVTGVAISGSSQSLGDAHDADVIAHYTICSINDPIMNITQPTPCPNLTVPIPTVSPYSGPKDLAIYDVRRELAVFDHGPHDLVLYAPPIDVVQLMISTRQHMLASTHRPLLQDDTHLFRAYLDRRNFVLAVVGATQDPVNCILAVAYNRAFIPILLDSDSKPQGRLSIGDSPRRPEDNGACALALLHIAGILFSLVYLSWVHWLGQSQQPAPQSADEPSVEEGSSLAQLVLSFPDEFSEDYTTQGGCELWTRDIDAITSICDAPRLLHAPIEHTWRPFLNAPHPALSDISGTWAASWQLPGDHSHLATGSTLDPLDLPETQLGPEPKPVRARKRNKRGRRSRK